MLENLFLGQSMPNRKNHFLACHFPREKRIEFRLRPVLGEERGGKDHHAVSRRGEALIDLLAQAVAECQGRLVIPDTKSYDVAPLVTLNGQLARRNRRVHLARYRNTPQDQETFEGILRDMDMQFSGFLSFSLQKHHKKVYERCIGLMGVLRDWLALAAKASITRDEKTISVETFFSENIQPPIDVLDTILDCAENGEANFYVTAAEEKEFKDRVVKQAEDE